MKFICAFIAFAFLVLIVPTNEIQASSVPFPDAQHCSLPAADELGDSHMVCFFVPPMILVCVTVYTDVKLDLPEEIKLKATLSKDGQAMSISGFPSEHNGVSLNLKKGEFSGFTHQDQKLFIQPGKYQINRGVVTLKLQGE